MTVENVLCNQCILPNGFLGIQVDSKGHCDFCRDPSHKNANWSKVLISEEKRNQSLEECTEILTLIKNSQETNEYSCVLGFSGGKDSTALLDTLVNEYNIKPFLVVVDTGYMTDVAKQNIKDTITKMDLYDDHVIVESAIPTFTKLYRHFFMNHSSNEKTLTIDICHTCTDLIHTILVKEAMKKNIPYVLIGFSPDQIARYFFKTPKEDVLKDGIPREGFNEIVDDSDMRWYLNPDTTEVDMIPEVIYPYHVLDYDEVEIIKRIEAKGLIKVGKSDPILTNCHVAKAAAMYDLYRYGGLTYAVQFAELIRQESDDEARMEIRKDWLKMYNRISRSILKGTFNAEGMRMFFERIGISKEELLKTITDHQKDDPNKDIILRNLELIKTHKLQ